jgi:carboxyl-terminal processing protease
MKSFPRRLLSCALMLVSSHSQVVAAADFNEVGKAMTIMLGDTHFEALRFDKNLNRRILDLYLDTLDPDRLYFTQGDVEEFANRHTGDSPNCFDILLLRSRGMEPARDIYTRFATRVVERTEFIETLTDKAAFDFSSDTLVPRSREKAPWPGDTFAAQRIWRLKIADEILTEQLLQEEKHRTLAQPAVPKPEVEEKPAAPNPQQEAVEQEEPEAEGQTPREVADEKETTTPIVATESEEEKLLVPSSPASETVLAEPQAALNTEEARKVVKTRYLRFKETVQSAADEEIADYFFSAVAQAHDPHSDYLSAKENDRFDQELRNQLTGIGAELASEADGSTRIAGIIVNGPAHRQGKLQPADRIVAIDPLNDGRIIDITYLPIERVVQLILGRKNTFVGLIVENRRPDDFERRKVVVKRGTIELKNAAAAAEVVKIAQSEGPSIRLGWITIPSFYLDFEDGDPSVYKDVKKLVSRMKREGVDGIAIDLRGNGGGSLTEVPRLAGLFLPRGPVVQAKNQNGNVEILSTTPLKPDYEGPLVVVTDRESVSSSEIFAAVLQDYNRAILVGDSSTFGKGTVQEKMGVANFLRFMQDPRGAGDLKATVQKFYRVTGSSTQLRGVIPHVILPSLYDSREIGERFLPHALPHDNISSARGFRPLSSKNLFLPEVTEKSRARVHHSPDFAYVREDLVRAEGKRMSNVVTLNREKRLADSEKEQDEIVQRNQERRERFALIEQKDQQRFHFLRLTLEDAERAKLETVDRKRDSQAIILRAEEEETDPFATPEWPSGLDPVKREALAILEDFVGAKKADAELKDLKKTIEANF